LLLLFLRRLEARLLLRGALARLLLRDRVAGALLFLRRLEASALLLLGRLHSGRDQSLARLFLVPRRLGPGCFLQFHPANPFLFLRRPRPRGLERLARLEPLLLQPELFRGPGLLSLEPCGRLRSRCLAKLLIRHDSPPSAGSNGNLKL